VLTFDNEDGGFPLDLSEVEISRRLYRSGESDYRLAGRSVRLSDLQALMAQAGMGAGSYAVIGQGMIDSFLLSSPAERKLLFDEAAGIRGPELARESAMRKLEATATNLVRLRDISAELQPRLALLEQVTAASRLQQELQTKADRLRRELASARAHEWSATVKRLERRHIELQDALKAAQADQAAHQRKLTALQHQAERTAGERATLADAVAGLETDRDQVALELAAAQTAVTTAEQAGQAVRELARQLKAAQDDVSAAFDRIAELEDDSRSHGEAVTRAEKAVEAAHQLVSKAQSELVSLRRRSADGTRDQYVDHAMQILKTMAISLGKDQLTMSEVKILVHKAGRLLSHASKDGAASLLTELKAAQKRLEAAMAKRDTATEHQTNVTITARSLEIDLAHQREVQARLLQTVDGIEQQLEPVVAAAQSLAARREDLAGLERRLSQATASLDDHRTRLQTLTAPATGGAGLAELATQLERTRARASSVEAELTAVTEELSEAQHEAAAAGPAHGAAPRQSAAELADSLMRAELQLEAQTGAAREQAAEYAVVKDRTTELTTQIADLEVAQADLEGVIAELDDQIRTRFKRNFAKLSDQFSAYFTRLFDGGAAALELVETESGYGVNIKASPRGKRLSVLTALSGGERALTGVALLAAIMRVNPSPFVVLDEIDAALDEANSGRLATILEELQQHSQLIVITHNRQTMQAAKVLFGITLSEHHVSRLLSMRLELAAR
jgi:chromosome segregation protein